jgi:hypothetical protein
LQENSQIWRKRIPSKCRKPQNRHNPNRTSLWHIIVKTIITENKEIILKVVREENQITYKGKHQNDSRFFKRNLKSKKGME